ncbi:YesL family protein [Celeribacter sp.]|uniref:YesL family protein n=1 Tax=Celeribacter sp. TaxID=1890673 RepID=UPI003A8DA067
MAAINLVALLLIIAGLGALGFFPALVGVFYALDQDETKPLRDTVRDMLREYKREFLRANLLGLVMLIIATTGLFVGSQMGPIVLAVALAIAFFALAIALSGVMSLSRLSGRWQDGFHNAWTGVLCAPYRHALGLVLLPGWLWFIVDQPLLGLYFGLTAPAYVARHLINPALASVYPPSAPSEVSV